MIFLAGMICMATGLFFVIPSACRSYFFATIDDEENSRYAIVGMIFLAAGSILLLAGMETF